MGFMLDGFETGGERRRGEGMRTFKPLAVPNVCGSLVAGGVAGDIVDVVP